MMKILSLMLIVVFACTSLAEHPQIADDVVPEHEHAAAANHEDHDEHKVKPDLSMTEHHEEHKQTLIEHRSRVTHEISLEDTFLQAQNMQATKGDNACQQLANDLKQVVATNVKALQGDQNKMDKGLACKDEGQPVVKSAQESLATAQTAKHAALNAHNAASTAKVDFGSESLDNLDPSKCVFFQMSSYTAAVKKREDAKEQLETAKELVTFAETELKNAEDEAKTAVLKCKCDIFTSHETALGKRNVEAESANKKGWTKAEHLICVLEGKDMKACTVSSIPKVEAAKGLCKGCDADACATHAPPPPPPSPPPPSTYELPDDTTIDSCEGFRVLPSTCGGGNIAYAVSKENTFDKKHLYGCPAGWHWMKAHEYEKELNFCQSHPDNRQQVGLAYSGKCGWNGQYPPVPFKSGQTPIPNRARQYFYFADSSTTSMAQFSRAYPGQVSHWSASNKFSAYAGKMYPGFFAGIVCRKN